MDIRKTLELANAGQVQPQQLYECFGTQVPSIYVLYLKTEEGNKPILSKSNRPDGKYVVAFTDVEAAKQVKVHHPEQLELVKESALSFMLKVFRSDAEGVVFNPSLPSRLFLIKQHLHNLILEYCIQKLRQLPGAWIPTMNSNLLLAEYQKGLYTVAIYASEKDAERATRKAGGEVVQHPWQTIAAHCRQLNAPGPMLHFLLPEQILLQPEHLERIVSGPHIGYQEPEAVVIPFLEGQQPVQSPESAPTMEEQPKVENPANQEVDQSAAAKPNPQIEPKMDTIPIPVVLENEEEKAEEKKVPAAEQEATVEKVLSTEENKSDEPQEKSETEISEALPQQVEAKIEEQKETPVKAEDLASKVQENQEPKNPEEKMESVETPLSSPTSNQTASPNYEEVLKYSPSANDPQVLESLATLEKVTIQDNGNGMGWEVCDALAKVRRIWIVMDENHNMVILAGQRDLPIIDLFTSIENAQTVINKTRERNPNLPPMRPQLVSTKKLFRSLAKKEAVVWINRESNIAWCSPKVETIPYVLQLMKQYGIVQ